MFSFYQSKFYLINIKVNGVDIKTAGGREYSDSKQWKLPAEVKKLQKITVRRHEN